MATRPKRTVTVDGDQYQAIMTFEAITAIEDRCGTSCYDMLVKRFALNNWRTHDVAVIINETTRAAGNEVKYTDLGEWMMDQGMMTVEVAEGVVGPCINLLRDATRPKNMDTGDLEGNPETRPGSGGKKKKKAARKRR